MATASGSGDVLRPSEGKTRFLRLTRLLICGGTKVMRELFNDKIPPANLATCLGSPDVKRRLKKKKQDRFLTLRQWQVLYPSSGAGPVQSTSFDISLLFKLLRENVISGLSPPSTGWDKLPSLTDLSLPADMARIKYYRNIISHIDETMEIEESDFSDYWKEIKDALLRIVGHCAASGSSTVNDWEKDIDNLLTDPLTEAELESVEELKKWYLEDMQLKEMLNENNKLLKGLISMNSKDFNIRCAVRIAGVGVWLGGNLYVLDSLKDNPEALIKFVKYSIVPSGLVLVSFAFGSIKITVRVETLEALDEILKRNKAGRLEKDLEKVLITEKMKNLANGQQIKLNVQIDEQKLMAIRKRLKKGKKLVPGRTCKSLSFPSVPDDAALDSLSKHIMMKDMLVNFLKGNAHFDKQEHDEAISYGRTLLSSVQECDDKENDMKVYIQLGVAYLIKQEYDDAISYGEKWLPLAQECGDKENEMHAYALLCKAYFNKKKYDKAISYGNKLLSLAQACANREAEMSACWMLSHAHLNKEEYDDAISYGEKCLPLAQECGEKDAEMKVYTLFRDAHLGKDDDDAILYSKRCLEMAQESGSKEDEMDAYAKLGHALLIKEENEDMIFYGKEWLSLAKACGDTEAEMAAYLMLGHAHLNKQEYDDAIPYSKKGLAMAQECGHKESEISASFLLVKAYLNKQAYDDAISYGEKSLTIAQECGDKENEMKAYTFLCEGHFCKQEYDDAIRYSKKCLAMAQESGSKEDEMRAYTTIGHALMKKEENEDIIFYGKEWLPRAQAYGDKKAEMVAYLMLGHGHFCKQEYDDAIPYSKTGLAMAQECGDKMFELKAYALLSNAHFGKQKYDDAISYGEKYLSIAQECGDKDAEMEAYESLGNLFLNKEEYDEAISYYEKRLSMAQQSNDKVPEMKTYLLIGETHLRKEEYEEALRCGTKCLAIAKESGDKEEEMDAYSLIGTAHWKNNAYDDAHSCFTKGKKIAMDLKDDSRTSTFQSRLSMTYEEVGIETSGIFDADISYNLLFKRVNKHGDEFKWPFPYLEYVLYKQKDEYKQAISCLKEAEATLPTTQPRNDSIECRKKRWLCKKGIAEMYVKLRQHDQAMKYQEEALAVAVTRSQQAASHFSLGKLYCNKPDRQLENAKQSLEESLKCYELIFQDLKENDRFKIFFVDKYKEVYKMLLKVLVETNKKEEALVLSDRYRAKALKDLLVSSYGMKKDPTAEETAYLQYADVQTLVSCRNYSLLFYSSCDEKLCTFLVQTGKELEFSVQHFEYCDKCLDELVNKAYGDMMRQVVKCEDQSLDVKDDSEENKNPKEDELTRMLTRQKEERLTEQCRSICGCRGNLSVKRDDATTNAQKMKHHNDDRNLVEEDENAVNPEGPSGLEILYNKLIYNIKCLFKKEEILIIPEGPLCKVPFAALQDPETGQYLSETKRIRMAPSMATLKFLQEAYPKEHSHAKEPLVIGDPLVGQVMMTKTAMEITQLPGAREEAKHIGSILGVKPFLEADATKTAVIKRLQEGASIVHIAAHGSLEKATILLAPAPELRENEKIPVEEDYMLTMADVQQAQVRAQLVVLSCCYTGRGEIKSEGVVGLCRAFLASGARAVMGSLWAVHDDATMEFMKTFYKYLKDGKSASTSLHLTMNDMRKTPKYSKPMFWAPFFLMGDDVTIKFED